MNGDNFQWDKGQAIADEGLSLHEKLKYVKASQICSVACFILSIPIIVIYIIYSSEIEHKYLQALLTLGILSALLSIIVFVWSLLQQDDQLEQITNEKLNKMVEKLADKTNVMAIIIFCGSAILILLYICFLMFVYVQRDMSLDYYKVNHTPDEILQQRRDLHYFIDIFAICSVIQMIFNGLFAYSTYVVALNHQDSKIILNVFNLVWIFFSLMAFFESKYCLHLFDIREMSMYASSAIIHITLWISIFSICGSIAIFYVNIRRSRVGYLALGTLLLILITIYTGLNHQIIRDAQDSRAGFINHCNTDVIQQCPREWLSSHRCDKYMTKLVNNVKIYDSTSCPSDFQSLVWEDDEGKAQNEKKNNYACINMKCCYVMSDSYSVWFYRLAFTTFACICCGFLMSLLCFLLSQKDQLSNEFTITICDAIFGLIFVILIFFFFYYAFSITLPYIPQRVQGAKQMNQDNQILLMQHHQSFQAEELKSLSYQTKDNFEEQVCTSFRSLLDKDFHLQTDCNTLKCTDNTGLRVSLLSKGGKLVWNSSLSNVQDLRFYQKKYMKQIFSNADEATDDFVSIEGKSDSINDFYNKHLHYCGATLVNSPVFIVESFQTEIPILQSGTVKPEPNFQDHRKQAKQISHKKNSSHKQSQDQTDIQLQKCQDNLFQASSQYSIKCEGAQGKFQQEIGNFRKQINVDLISAKYHQEVVGYITAQDFCNQEQQVRLSDITVSINFKDNNKQYVQYSTAKTDQNGYFKFTLPVFQNNIKYVGQIQINDQKYLPYSMFVTIGGGNVLVQNNVGNLPLVTPTGKPIQYKQCQGKIASQFITVVENKQQNKLPIIHNEDITPLQQCTNKLNKINQNLNTCSNTKINLHNEKKQKNQGTNLPQNLHLSESFTDLQRQQIDEIQFLNLEIIAYDVMKKNYLGDAQILIYKGSQPCQKLKQEPIFESQTNSEGQKIIYNFIVGTYTAHIKKQGYYNYCTQFTLNSPSQQQPYLLRAPMAFQSEKSGSGVVVLEHNNVQLSASLTASVIYDSQTSCLLTYFNQNCQDLSLSQFDSVDPLLGQAISFEHLGPYNYLFYVTKVPQSNEEKELVEEIRAGIQLTDDQLKTTVHNEQFFRGNLKIKMYFRSQEYHVSSYEIPDPVEDKLYDPILTWLSICIDGVKGFESQRSISKFWEKSDQSTNNFWQDKSDYKSLLPNSNICNKYYQQVPYLD